MLKYLICTSEEGILFHPKVSDSNFKDTDRDFIVHDDADWDGERFSSIYQSVFLVFAEQNLISWKLMRQNCVSLSSCESEYYSASEGVRHEIAIQQSVFELKNLRACEDEDELDAIHLKEYN